MEESPKKIKIAIISSFTFDLITKRLNEACEAARVSSEIYLGKYGQHIQEIMQSGSGLYDFHPDVVIVFIDTKALLGNLFFEPYTISDEERRIHIQENFSEIKTLIQTLLAKTSAKIILHNFEVPQYSPLGILENKQKFGFGESIQFLNAELRDAYKFHDRVFVFDYENFVSKLGKQEAEDPKMYYLADMKLDFRHFPALAYEYMSYIKPILSLTKKCLVLDLDNTLWGGVVGEDGVSGVKLGPTPEGKPFLEFQKYILNLFKRGIILAINSKNNIEDVLELLRKHPSMILREEYFAAMKINWNDKISNMKDLAQELNIGLDSFVFLDDDKANRELVKLFLPEVEVVDMPDDPALYVRTLSSLNSLNMLQMTDEDRDRGLQYATQRKRKESEATFKDIESFLRSLNVKVFVLKSEDAHVARIAQLTQKTNQFNLTTKRYHEDQIRDFVRSKEYVVRCVRVEDKFGDYGLTGVYIIKKDKKIWVIDTLLLSCRVLGKNVEFGIMAGIIAEARKAGAETLIGEFFPTKKNLPANNFLKNCAFTLQGKSAAQETWIFDVRKYQAPEGKFVEIIS